MYFPRYTIPPTEVLTRPARRWSAAPSGGGFHHTGVAGWAGGPTTPEPALGAHDRLNTTDVPEEIEARPDKSICFDMDRGKTDAMPNKRNENKTCKTYILCLKHGLFDLQCSSSRSVTQTVV